MENPVKLETNRSIDKEISNDLNTQQNLQADKIGESLSDIQAETPFQTEKDVLIDNKKSFDLTNEITKDINQHNILAENLKPKDESNKSNNFNSIKKANLTIAETPIKPTNLTTTMDLDKTFISQSRETEIFSDFGRLKLYIEKLRNGKKQLERKYEDDMNYLSNQHKNDIEKIKKKNKEEIEEITKSFKDKELKLNNEYDLLKEKSDNKIKELEEVIEKNNNGMKKNQEIINNLNNALEIKDKTITRNEEKISKLTDQISEMETFLKTGDEDYEKLVKSFDDLKKENEKYKQKLEDLHAELEKKENNFKVNLEKKNNEIVDIINKKNMEMQELINKKNIELLKINDNNKKINEQNNEILEKNQKELMDKSQIIEDLEQEVELEKIKVNEIKELKNKEIKELKEKLFFIEKEFYDLSDKLQKNTNITKNNSNNNLNNNINNKEHCNSLSGYKKKSNQSFFNNIPYLQDKIKLVESNMDTDEKNLFKKEAQQLNNNDDNIDNVENVNNADNNKNKKSNTGISKPISELIPIAPINYNVNNNPSKIKYNNEDYYEVCELNKHYKNSKNSKNSKTSSGSVLSNKSSKETGIKGDKIYTSPDSFDAEEAKSLNKNRNKFDNTSFYASKSTSKTTQKNNSVFPNSLKKNNNNNNKNNENLIKQNVINKTIKTIDIKPQEFDDKNDMQNLPSSRQSDKSKEQIQIVVDNQDANDNNNKNTSNNNNANNNNNINYDNNNVDTKNKIMTPIENDEKPINKEVPKYNLNVEKQINENKENKDNEQGTEIQTQQVVKNSPQLIKQNDDINNEQKKIDLENKTIKQFKIIDSRNINKNEKQNDKQDDKPLIDTKENNEFIEQKEQNLKDNNKGINKLNNKIIKITKKVEEINNINNTNNTNNVMNKNNSNENPIDNKIKTISDITNINKEGEFNKNIEIIEKEIENKANNTNILNDALEKHHKNFNEIKQDFKIIKKKEKVCKSPNEYKQFISPLDDSDNNNKISITPNIYNNNNNNIKNDIYRQNNNKNTKNELINKSNNNNNNNNKYQSNTNDVNNSLGLNNLNKEQIQSPKICNNTYCSDIKQIQGNFQLLNVDSNAYTNDEYDISKPLSERRPIFRNKLHKSTINAILSLMDNSFMVATDEGEIAVYKGNKFTKVIELKEFDGKSVRNLTLLSDNSIIACGYKQMKRIIFDQGYLQYNIIQVLSEGYTNFINKATELTTFDLITCGDEPKVPIWREDETTGQFYLFEKSILNEKVNSIIQGNETIFITSSCSQFPDGCDCIRFFNISNYQQIKKIDGLSCSPFPNSMVLLNDFTLSVGLSDGIILIDLENYKSIKTKCEPIICLENITNDILLSTGSTSSIKKLKEWFFDGRKLEVVGTQNNLHSRPISSMAILENGYLVTGSFDHSISVLD